VTALQRIDLHVHSTASDGTDTPAEVVRAAAATGLDVVALTDHDNAYGWAEAVSALPPGLTLVRGMEISCVAQVDGRAVSLHLLAYLLDPDEPALAGELAALRESRLGRGEAMVRRLVDAGHPVTWERVIELADGGSVGRPHVARALVEAGVLPDVSAAFTPEWLADHGRYWVPKAELDPAEAVRLVAGAGGVAVFAHPLASSRGAIVDEATIEAMAEAGLAGLEADHPDHLPDARRRAREIAERLDLVVTGSSDYHGSNKVQGLGAELTAPAAYEALVARATALQPITG
jgi:predicted metal-dependent phosphoesterase TrpH